MRTEEVFAVEDGRQRDWNDRRVGGYTGRLDGAMVETPTHIYSRTRAMLYPDRLVVRDLDGRDLLEVIATQEPVPDHPGWWTYGDAVVNPNPAGCRTCGGTKITKK